MAGDVLVCVIVGVSIFLMLIRPGGISEVYWVGTGVVLLLTMRLIDIRLALQGAGKALDVCFFLIGMMLLCELAREHGVFDWLSAVAVQKADGSCMRLFALVYALGTIVTIFLSNDATAVVLTPAILVAVRKAKVEPLPYLFVCALIANAASFVLPISNPANLVVFHNAMPPLAKWLAAFGVPCLFSVGATFLVLRWFFRAELSHTIDQETVVPALSWNGKLVLRSTTAMIGVLLVTSSLGKDLGLPTCLSALAVITLICVKERRNPSIFLHGISWSTLLLVVGLFIMVDAVENVGVMRYTREWLAWVQSLGLTAGVLVTGFGIGVANNLVNNLPLGLIVGGTLHAAQASSHIIDAAMIGIDLGPNLSIAGSLATILWLIALRKEGLDVGFWDFLKVGVLVMPVTLFASLLGCVAMHLLSTAFR